MDIGGGCTAGQEAACSEHLVGKTLPRGLCLYWMCVLPRCLRTRQTYHVYPLQAASRQNQAVQSSVVLKWVRFHQRGHADVD